MTDSLKVTVFLLDFCRAEDRHFIVFENYFQK